MSEPATEPAPEETPGLTSMQSWLAAAAVDRIRELHTPMDADRYSLGTVQVCEHCYGLCHSETGLGCEDPVDAVWPCETVKLLPPAVDRG